VSGLLSRRLVLAGLLAAFLVGLSVPAALATNQGAALDTGRITVETQLVAGHLYRLATFSVRNPGTARTQYDLVVTPVATAARTPDPAWFSFAPKQVTLQSGKSQAVTLSLRLPKVAAAGEYETLVGARVAQSDSGTSVAAAAAALLSFSVASSQKATDDALPVWWPVLALAVAAVGLFLLRSRFRLRLERR
jgi:hypothetical protein